MIHAAFGNKSSDPGSMDRNSRLFFFKEPTRFTSFRSPSWFQSLPPSQLQSQAEMLQMLLIELSQAGEQVSGFMDVLFWNAKETIIFLMYCFIVSSLDQKGYHYTKHPILEETLPLGDNKVSFYTNIPYTV